MIQIHVLRNKGYSIRADEEIIKSRLETIMLEIQKTSSLKSKYIEISSSLYLYKERLNQFQDTLQYKVVDERALDSVFQVISFILFRLIYMKDIKRVSKRTFYSNRNH